MEAADDLVLDALGDRQRRAILRMLSERARPVHELAAELPISRPAVSRHLRLLPAFEQACKTSTARS
jgi:DNA-binding transcriptional ArsR family regulator